MDSKFKRVRFDTRYLAASFVALLGDDEARGGERGGVCRDFARHFPAAARYVRSFVSSLSDVWCGVM